MSWIRSLRPIHLAVGVPWIVAVTAALQPIRDNSFLWHITAGRLQEAGGVVLTQDPFSYTRFGEAWRTQSWLADLLYSNLDEAWGLSFVPWMVAGVAIATFACVSLVVYGVSKSVAAVAISGVATAWVSAAFLSPRPVLFSYLFLGLVVALARDRRLYWAIPLLLWVWAGIHASFPIAILYLALEAWRRRDSDLLARTVAGGVLTLFTAHGWGVVSILLGFVESRGALDLITEWALPDVVSVRFLPVIPALLVLIYGAGCGRVSGRDLVVVGPILFFLFTASRAVFPAWLLLLVFLAMSLSDLWKEAEVGGGVVGLNLAALLMIALLPALFAGETGLDPEVFPVEVAASLEASAVFHDDVVGGYLIYRDHGERRVFVDDRAELYGEQLFADVIETRSGTPTWRAVFAVWEIEEALLSVDDALVEELEREGWVARVRDEHFALLARPR